MTLHPFLFAIPLRALRSRRGAATLPAIIALTILILAVGVSITAISFTEGLISVGQGNAAQALVYAEAGAHDALIKLARNKQYVCVTEDCYTIDLVADGCATDDGCARVSVSAGVGTLGDPRIIVSEGKARSSVRRLQVSVVFDAALDGEIATTTWREL